MNKLARIGPKGDAIDTPSVSSYRLSLKMKSIPDVAKQKSCFNSCFMSFSYGLFSKISSNAISVVSGKGVLVEGLQTSYETKKNNHYRLPVVFHHKN